jgi:hypothetical protein
VVSMAEGGFPSQSLAGQPAALVRAVLRGTKGPVVSRWGHILLRRALASRLDAPRGMSPVAFAALRASALNGLGEGMVARSLVQDVDSANYDKPLTDAAFNAYLATGDLLGMCPVARLKGDIREDADWKLLRSICSAYAGEARSAERALDRALGRGEAPRIDVLLAQRYAGAAGDGRRAVNIEWDGVEELTLWRFSLARALGVDLPEGLRARGGTALGIADTMIPAVPLAQRLQASELAASRGVLSSLAMVDLYSQAWANAELDETVRAPSGDLRDAYVAQSPRERLAAMQRLWGDGTSYGRAVLTSYAAARLPVSEDFASDAGPVVSSMLAAGLDRNAARWTAIAPEGSLGWALLAVGRPGTRVIVDSGAVDEFISADDSDEQRKSQFLLAGLAGLGRLDSDDVTDIADELEVNLARESKWSRAIGKAAEYGNPALVSMLAGLGMQGDGWDKMTARHLYHIVRSLRVVGLEAEARMIAAEAVARG